MDVSSSTLRFPAVGKLGRLSAFMCFVVALGGALAEIAVIWIWLSPELLQTLVVPRLGLIDAPVDLKSTTRLIGFAISMVPMAVLFFMLHQAYELFDTYRLGNIFAAQAPSRLRRIGLSTIALAFLRPLTGALLTVALTAANPQGQRHLAISISLDDYMLAAFGGLLLAIGHVMVEATRLAEENRQFV